MIAQTSRTDVKSRYRISGDLVLVTALHLGGGRNPAKGTDSPIMRDGFARPFIPGSSLKGALRTTVERIVPNLNISACGLYVRSEMQRNETKDGSICLTPLEENDEAKKNYRELEAAIGKPIDDKLEKNIKKLLNPSYEKHKNDIVTEDLLLAILRNNLCQVCQAFGSPFLSSSIYFHDASVNEEKWLGLTQIRDGVGIDRDSGRAVDSIKYDYEVVPPQTVFNFSMTVETGDKMVLGLTALALHEFEQSNVLLGGIRSRGLGRCKLAKETVKIDMINFGDPTALKAYLTKNELKTLTLDEFISLHIKNLWAEPEASNV